MCWYFSFRFIILYTYIFGVENPWQITSTISSYLVRLNDDDMIISNRAKVLKGAFAIQIQYYMASILEIVYDYKALAEFIDATRRAGVVVQVLGSHERPAVAEDLRCRAVAERPLQEP